MNRSFVVLLTWLVLVAPVTVRAGAGAPDLALAPVPDEVHAGDVVTLRWTAPGPGFEELEILLSVDGGRTFPLRVSPQLDPAAGEYRWRVPDLTTSGARLRVRIGDEHRELECEPSAAFRIVGDRALAPGVVHEAGWWDGPDAPRAGDAAGVSGTTLRSNDAPAGVVGSPRSSRLDVEAALRPFGDPSSPAVTWEAGGVERARDARPSRVPMRN